jgi:hypothetical protein
MQQHFKHITLASLLIAGVTGCSSQPEWVEVYEDCQQKMTTASEEMKANSEDNPQAKAMVEAMGNMAKAVGMAACESIKQMCEPDPDGGACQMMVQEYKKNKEK